ncbi:MAG: hypothetical protein Q6363_009585 [Candidatus Njordarchaeota archaeon]
MGTITSTMLIGGTHPYHGGIIPTHIIFFWENDCPSLTLIRLREGPIPGPFGIVDRSISVGNRKVSWVPGSWDDMLEDALLMVGIYVLEIPELVSRAEKIFKDMTRIGLSDTTEKEKEIRELRKILKKHIGKYDIKIVLSVMLDSTILRQIPKLIGYKVAFEVCITRFQRLRNYWDGGGRLENLMEDDYANVISERIKNEQQKRKKKNRKNK